ncbi:hypothetical protein PENTCL1PPCAC_22460, partial [Pristionchus entomophagus]
IEILVIPRSTLEISLTSRSAITYSTISIILARFGSHESLQFRLSEEKISVHHHESKDSCSIPSF